MLRIDNIDPLREQSGIDQSFLPLLRAHGLEPCEPPVYQFDHLHRHRQILAQLQAEGRVYACPCSRQQIQRAGHRPDCGLHHGARQYCPEGGLPAWRFRCDGERLLCEDRRLGSQEHRLTSPADDFVVWRKEDLPAYHLAVVVDDHDAGITHVVRGADLHDCTPAHLALYQALGWPAPVYLHTPIVVDAHGVKLSKQTGASAIRAEDAHYNLRRAMRVLGLFTHEQNLSLAGLLESACLGWPELTREWRENGP